MVVEAWTCNLIGNAFSTIAWGASSRKGRKFKRYQLNGGATTILSDITMDIGNSGLRSYLLTVMVVNTGIAWGEPLRSPEPLLGLGCPAHLQNKQTT